MKIENSNKDENESHKNLKSDKELINEVLTQPEPVIIETPN